MAWIIPVENTTTAVDLGINDSLYIGRRIYFGTTATGIGSNQSIIVEGEVAAGGSSAFQLGAAGTTNNLIHITQTGRVVTLGNNGSLTPAMTIAGTSGKVINDGTIIATFNNGAGLGFIGQVEGASNSLVNTGTIEAGSIAVYNANLSGTFTLTNTGTIIGGDGETVIPQDPGLPPAVLHWGSFLSLSLTDGQLTSPNFAETINNSGLMVGDIWFGGGADYYEGRNGRVDGDVHGGTGADRLFSGLGNDRLFGEDGNDQLMGGPGGDLLNGGAGTDIVLYTTAATGVTASLSNAAINTGDAAGDSYVSIENLTGSNFNDVLVGNGANNILSGGTGNDTLRGAAGNDILAGGAGRDNFVFAAPLNAMTNVDKINDFSVVDDTIQLENTYFAALTTTGVLAASALQINTTGVASTANDRIIYESDTGNLYYDPDGTGGAAATLFAKLALDLALTNADFVVI